jgi:ribose transport system ATP-binding protein
LLSFRGITKAFSGVPVLADVDFDLAPGSVLGLLGENGAGKSTLMNILAGNLVADAGEMTLEGRPYAPRHPREAAQHGVALIHQELNLFPNLSIAENLFLTRLPRHRVFPLIRRRELHRRTATLLAKVGLDLAPDVPVSTLSAGERQLVEIAAALSTEARVMIFDEPTTSLSQAERQRLFDLIVGLRARGHAIIFISHNLGDVFRVCDTLVILRDGRVVGRGAAEGFTEEHLVSLMVGRALTRFFPDRTSKPGSDPVLEVRGITQPGIVAGIGFTLYRGEVLGLSGLMGSGRSELARILFGLDPAEAGEIRLMGEPLRPEPRECIRRHLAFLTEDRRSDGLFFDATIHDNIALVSLDGYARTPVGWLDRSALRDAVGRIGGAVRLPPNTCWDQPVHTLSGGNQQKVLLARWLLTSPSVLILDEPTRGIDVGAKAEIYRLIGEVAARGAGVLVISSEMDELIGLCDRILIMSRGEIRDEIPHEQFGRERILRAALHRHPGGSPDSPQGESP